MSINTRTGRPNPVVREGIAAELAAIRAQRFIVQNDTGPINALDDVLAYVDECERVGVSMHPADVRSLIATALGVAA